ncbi:hypothetical protein FCL47_00555 [Desulfopila sp. IMCC35006]|uniref:glycosyltransferase family 10 domain-containing protein n=1 Tax=Desulfopila sp. IMCC35006 TaxID=2569542 RepID=UPI0010ACAB24|nr:glycosyltransferase family 10 [Desulfopila sp. IMCC35006]TKB28019.1 hypothetical protein FCL47_00555 [Desulfopila sp. IMCC35006]
MQRGLKRGVSAQGYIRQFPDSFPQWGNCLFDFDVDCTDYDWLVVYHDIPQSDDFFSQEKLCCPRERTMLLTGEPSSITVFGRDYLRQFGCILTFQEPWAMRHPNVMHTHPGLMWFYGLPFGKGDHITWDQMAAEPPPLKSKKISTVCSERKGKVTLHSTRFDFTQRLKTDIPELEVFGHGVKHMVDKAEALDSYMYHIAIENYVYRHHLTEKLPDAFLGYTLPFYHGAPNAADYFPKESFIPIDINNYERARDIIQSHLANNEYQDRLPYIIEARRLVLQKENLFAILDNKICEQEKKITRKTLGKVIYNRQSLRIRKPLAGIRSLLEKVMTKAYHRAVGTSKNKGTDA